MAQILNRIRARLRRLRWQLTLSYMTVTVGTLLVVALILASFVLGPLFVPNDALTPEDWLEILNRELVPDMQFLLENPAITTDVIASVLGREVSDATINVRKVFQYGATQLLVLTTAQADLALVGADGALLGVSDANFLPGGVIGQPLDARSVPGLSEPLRAALAGEEDAHRLMHVFEPNERFLFAVPVFSAAESGERVLGAAVVNFRDFPSASDRPAHYVGVVTRSLLIFLLGAGLLGALFGSITASGLVRRFRRLSAAADAWSHGNFTKSVQDPTGDEISQLTQSLNSMAQQLETLLKQRQEMAVAEERNRLARDLHDSAKQQAFAASAQLGAALALFQEDPHAAEPHLVEAEKLVDKVRKELTDLILELRPGDLEAGGLAAALHKYAVDWAHHSDIEIDMQVHGGRALPLRVEQALFRIAQEALANTARHSQARHAEILLVYNQDAVTLTIVDDGCGFDATDPQPGMGLQSMRERAELVQGELRIESSAGEGTTVAVRCELREAQIGERDGG